MLVRPALVALSAASTVLAPAPLRERTVAWEPAAAIVRSYVVGTAREDWINAVVRTRNGDLVAAGYADRDDGKPSRPWHAVIIRFAPNGTVRWLRRIAAATMRAAWTVVESPSGDLAAAGLARSDAGDLDAWLLILDAAGRVKADRRFGGPRDDRAIGIIADPRGGYVLAGETASEGAGGRDAFVASVGPDGAERWRRTIGTAASERGFALAAAGDGWVAIGTRGSDPIRGYVIGGSFGGAIAWERELRDAHDVVPHFVRALGGDTVFISGYAGPPEAHAPFAAVANARGTLLRRARYAFAGDARAIESCAHGGAEWLAGNVAAPGQRRTMLLLRVAPSDLTARAFRVAGRGEAAYATACTGTPAALVVGGYAGADEEHGDLVVLALDPARLTGEAVAADPWPDAVWSSPNASPSP
jgi:hypothetical protein